MPQGAPAQAVPSGLAVHLAGHLCRIPALYVSAAGLTLDVLLFLDSGAVRTFCKNMRGWTASASRPWKSGCWRRTAHPGGFLFPAPDQRPACGAVRIQQLHLGSLCAARTARAAVGAVRAAYASLCLPGDCYVCHRVHALARRMQTAVKPVTGGRRRAAGGCPSAANSPSTK
ncbi:MAG: hypothetical protein ACLRZH_06095 [Ruthenibacterium lactatiformans]